MHDKPLADKGLTSYRYKGRFGYIMIGATDDSGALTSADRSLSSGNAIPEYLEVWTGESYEPVRIYDVVAVTEKTGATTKLNATPMHHQAACTFKSKFTKRDNVRIELSPCP